MASSSSLAPALPIKAMQNPGGCLMDSIFLNSSGVNRCQVKTMALPTNPSPKPKSVLCGDYDGNGAVLCSQCKGDILWPFDTCRLFLNWMSCVSCRGKKDMLCGNCNGAGFIGGFMSTFDE